MAVTMRALSRHHTREDAVLWRREPKPRGRPCSSAGRMSGYRSISHFGGVEVGVPSTTLSPAAPSVSIARSSQPQS